MVLNFSLFYIQFFSQFGMKLIWQNDKPKINEGQYSSPFDHYETLKTGKF